MLLSAVLQDGWLEWLLKLRSLEVMKFGDAESKPSAVGCSKLLNFPDS
jgi:hypothetical protein